MLLAALAAATAMLAAGPLLLRAVAPGIAILADLATPQLVTDVRVAGRGVDARIEAKAVVLAAVPLGRDAYVPPVTRTGPATFSMGHALVPVTLLAAVLLAWPCATRREAALRGLLFVPAAALLTLATASLHLAGLLDMMLLDAGAREGSALPVPWTVTALVFLESGGRWLAPLVLGVLCIAVARLRRRPRNAPAAPALVDAALIDHARRARAGAAQG